MEQPDQYFSVNENDKDLTEIRVHIPSLMVKNAKFWYPDISDQEIACLLSPDPKKIRNYGKKRQDQYWTRVPIPERLQKLEKSKAGDQREIWKYLSENKKDFEKEIGFIKRQWFHRIFGEWIYINGKPTWIDPWHWFFLSTWQADYQVIDRATYKRRTSKYAEYRDRDRRKFHFKLYGYTATENFKYFNEDGIAIPTHGEYEMIDTGERVCIGINYPKHRRDGATQNDLSIQYQVTTMICGAESFIIANKPATQKKHFHSKLIKAWRKQPFYFRPIHDGTDRPKSKLHFVGSATRQKDGKIEINQDADLESYIEFCEVIDRAVYDNLKVTGIDLDDENGKTLIDIYEGWQLKKPSFTQGGESTINPYAFSLHPSTVEEMETKGGANYKMLCDDSNYYQRNPITGQTESGLWTFFIPAYDGLENYIGPFGESIIDDPTPEQQRYTGRNHGSKAYIASRIERYKKQNTPKALRDLASFTRKHPMCYADCWRMQGGDLGFNIEKLNQRRDELNRLIAEKKDPRRKAIFVWIVPGEPNPLTAEEYLDRRFHLYNNQSHRVELRFTEDDQPFDFYVSKTLQPNQTNLKFWNDDIKQWQPSHEPQYIASADPVQYLSKMDAERREDKAKSSYAAMAMLYLHQDSDDDKLEHEKESNRFVLTYMSKDDSVDVHGEKMLMACIYFGSYMNPERNVRETVRWFEQRLYGGYLFRAWLAEEQKWAPYVGYQSQGKTLNALFRSVKDYIEYHIHKENHIEIVETYLSIKSKEEMTKHDLFPATAGCLYGDKLTYKEVKDYEFGAKVENNFNINDYFH